MTVAFAVLAIIAIGAVIAVPMIAVAAYAEKHGIRDPKQLYEWRLEVRKPSKALLRVVGPDCGVLGRLRRFQRCALPQG
jgi:hypothetical protein